MPIIGLVSDSHGDAPITQRAAELLARRGADLLLHLGDVGNEAVIDALLVTSPNSDQPLPVRLVFGNTDWDIDVLTRYAENLGLEVNHPVGRIDLVGGPLVFMHGDDSRAFKKTITHGADYLCYGHTHVASDRRSSRTRLVNPGALFRTRTPTVALLDTDRDDLSFLEVE